MLIPDSCLHGTFTCFITQFTVTRCPAEATVRRPTGMWGQQKWKVILMHQWSLGASSESPLRGGEHVILLCLPIAATTLLHGVCHHTICCSSVCWTSTNLANPWCPDFVSSQIHQEHETLELIYVLLSTSCSLLPFLPWRPFISRLIGNKSKAILLWDSFPSRRKISFPFCWSYLYYVTTEFVTFQKFQYSRCIWA